MVAEGQGAEPRVPVTLLAEGALPGLVLAFRMEADGRAQELPVDRAVDLSAPPGGLVWLHFNLADKRACQWIASSASLPPPARALVVAVHDHQQLYATEDCVYGVFSDLVRDLDRALEQTAYLNFAMTESLVVTGRRQSLQAVETMRAALASGRRVPNGAALIEGIVGEVATGIDRLLEGLARELDSIEDVLLIEAIADERRRLGRVRRTSVHLHRQLVGLRTLLSRFEVSDEEITVKPALMLATVRLTQRLDGLDQEVVALQERARLLSEEIGARLSEENARNLNALAILTAIFLPATLVTGIFGMNTASLPFTHTAGGSFWAFGLVVGAAALAWWLLRRLGVIRW
jgi:zinc transporter